jgi:hypothetical protein
MPSSIRPYRRIVKLPLAYVFGFGSLITLLVLSSGPAYAEWVALGESDSGTTVYVDRDTRLPKEKLVKMWILYNFTRVRTVAGESYFSNKLHGESDCPQARHRTLVDMRFSSTMGFGKVVYNKSSQGKWAPVAPEGHDQILWKLACHKP